ncbi:hypothetical protein K3495_g3635 [Podosphaera aphanis]|nr:hypothetical protein K3495_g3635 [Podosphaera aphanis]
MTTLELYQPSRALQTNELSDDLPCSERSPSNASLKKIPPCVPSPPQRRRKTEYYIHEPQYNMMTDDLSQWIFTEEELLNTPSIRDGLDPVEERCRRAKGVNFITQAGILLKLPQLTIATASIFFHRYFMRQTMLPEKGKNLTLTFERNIAATSLFLATKTEENCRKTREIVVAVAKVAQKNPSLIIDEQSKEYWKWRDSILILEEYMLEMLTFDLVVKTPHIGLLRYLEILEIEDNKSLRNTAWAFLNDSCMTPLCLLMSASDITIASIYFAVKLNNETLPDIGDMPWWHSINGDPEKIVRAVAVVDQFWTENPLNKTDRPQGRSPSSQDDLDRTRGRGLDPTSSSTGAQSDNDNNFLHKSNLNGSIKDNQIPPGGTPLQTDTTSGDVGKNIPSENEISPHEKVIENRASSQEPAPQKIELQESTIEIEEVEGNKEVEVEEPNELSSSHTQDSSEGAIRSTSRNSTLSPPKRKLHEEEETSEIKIKRLKVEEIPKEC